MLDNVLLGLFGLLALPLLVALGATLILLALVLLFVGCAVWIVYLIREHFLRRRHMRADARESTL